MVKLKKFKERKLTNKNIMISFALIITVLICVVISKSYAIYKMQKEFDVIKSKVGTFTNGDVKVAVLVDGKETSEFPSYETNYKIESVECTNGVTGSFDVENWQVTIADMEATSTKCTVSFNSKEKNEVTPINMSKKEILALNETLTDSFKATLKKELLNDTYPVGSIHMSTTDDTVEKVEEKFGGTWVKYSSGTTLVGDDGTNYITNDSSKGSGGSKTVTLTTANLPNHSHSFTPSGNVSSSFTGSQVTTSATDTNHAHAFSGTTDNASVGEVLKYYGGDRSYGINTSWPGAYNGQYGSVRHTHTFSGITGGMNQNSSHTHTVTAKGSIKSSFTGSAGTTGSTGSGTSFSVQNPYTVVYMYKRTA